MLRDGQLQRAFESGFGSGAIAQREIAFPD
jgi:hypothetical protein